MIEQLNCRLSTINRLIASVDKSLSALPAGNLHIHQIRGNIHYYADYEGYAKNRKTPIYDKKLSARWLKDLTILKYFVLPRQRAKL